MSNKARLIAQDYVDNISEQQSFRESMHEWLSEYIQSGQEIVLLNDANHIFALRGKIPISQIKPFIYQNKKKQIQFINKSLLWSSAPILKSKKLLGHVLILQKNDAFSAYMDTLLAVIIIGSIGAIVLSTLGGYLISATAVRPLNQMIQLVERIEADQLSERLATPKNQDEIARLALTFNRMLDRIERSFEQQNRFVANASHEVLTPLTTIQGYANLLDRWGKNDPKVLEKAIQVIKKESTRLQALANNLLTLASLETNFSLEKQQAFVNQIVEETLESFRVLHPNIFLSFYSQENLSVSIHSDQLKQIYINILDNAIKYSPLGSDIVTHTFRRGDFGVIQVTDSGKGIPKEEIPFLAERFYRVEKSRERKNGGTGLGLSIVHEIIQHNHGSFSIESELGVGTRVIIELPLST